MESAFIGRRHELDIFDNLWSSPKASLMVLYGRRRVGKTRLMTHWMKRHPGQSLYWMAEATSALDQLRSFSQALSDFEDPEIPAPADLTFPNWEYALRKLALLAKERRIAVFIDEITYLIDVNPSFVGTLQKVWDHYLSQSNLVLAMSGSQMGVMQRKLLSYDAPLYGRSTAQIRLAPLPFGATGQYFPQYTPAERVMLYAIWGGIPAYWERLDKEQSVFDNVRQQLQPSNAWMLDESRLLLQDFINDPHNYVGLMRAISQGVRTFSLIGKRTGLSTGHTSRYLSLLRETGFVERRTPITDNSPDSRQGRYFVTDPYLLFYYRFLAANQSKLALGQQQQTLEAIETHLPAFIGDNTFPDLCREWLLRASAHGDLPVPIEDVGGDWRRNYMVEVAGISEVERSLVLGVCVWGEEPAGLEEIRALIERTRNVVPKDGEEWTVYYVGFSARGWSETAQREATSLVTKSRRGRARNKWRAAGLRLLDLTEIDADVTRWTV